MRPLAQEQPAEIDPLLAEGVTEFGGLLGLARLALDERGRAALRLQSGVTLRLLLGADEVVLQIDCPLAFEGPELLARALLAADLRRGAGLQPGLVGRGADLQLLLARRLPAREATAVALARQFEQLLDAFEALRRPPVYAMPRP